jgi:hypothetical protein
MPGTFDAVTNGPMLAFREGDRSFAGPSMFDFSVAMLDPRSAFSYPGQTPRGFLNAELLTIDAVPVALAAANISASASPGAGAIVLVSTSGAGVTVGGTVVNALTGVTDTGLLVLDTAMTPLALGPGGLWDPSKIIARALRFVSGGNDSGITFTVRGYDIYGFPMTETVTGGNVATANGKKAWKYIKTITHTGSVAGTLSIGTTDIIGLPLRCDTWGYANIMWNNVFVTANTGFVAADTNTATATTGDVRGTYTLQGAASNGTLRLIIQQSLMAAALGADTGIFGVTQFSG